MNRLRRLVHDWLGWGFPSRVLLVDDLFQPVHGCEFCTGRLAKDSQGNWFHLGNKRCVPQ